jgi:DNA-binding beta-propeller fold protein YncE
VEVPFVLWIFFFVLFFPMVNLATMFLRLTFLYGATHNACISAARARTFLTQINSDPAAVTLAQDGANGYVAAFTGIHVLTIDTVIVITNITTQAQTISTTPLTTPPDIGNFTYQVQVTVNGATDPLFLCPTFFFIPIAGLNQPMFLTISDRQYFENPQGLVF